MTASAPPSATSPACRPLRKEMMLPPRLHGGGGKLAERLRRRIGNASGTRRNRLFRRRLSFRLRTGTPARIDLHAAGGIAPHCAEYPVELILRSRYAPLLAGRKRALFIANEHVTVRLAAHDDLRARRSGIQRVVEILHRIRKTEPRKTQKRPSQQHQRKEQQNHLTAAKETPHHQQGIVPALPPVIA